MRACVWASSPESADTTWSGTVPTPDIAKSSTSGRPAGGAPEAPRISAAAGIGDDDGVAAYTAALYQRPRLALLDQGYRIVTLTPWADPRHRPAGGLASRRGYRVAEHLPAAFRTALITQMRPVDEYRKPDGMQQRSCQTALAYRSFDKRNDCCDRYSHVKHIQERDAPALDGEPPCMPLVATTNLTLPGFSMSSSRPCGDASCCHGPIPCSIQLLQPCGIQFHRRSTSSLSLHGDALSISHPTGRLS